MAEIPFEFDAENQGGSGLEYNGNEIPQDKIDFLAHMLMTLYGPNYLQDQIRENDLSPETT